MTEVSVTSSDIASLADALAGSSLPASDLLASIVSSILAVCGDEESVTLRVEVVDSLADTFAAAFEPDPAPSHGTQQAVRVMKITR
jgi:hypothetical protein